MKSEIVATVVGGIVAVVVLSFCFLNERDKREVEANEQKIAQSVSVEETDEVIFHDWECKFCIEDGYNGNGKVMYHYINEYTRNVSHSISFVGHDGLLWTIPYPYFYIHVNEHYKGSDQNVNPNNKK
jgi:hypothetical protein